MPTLLGLVALASAAVLAHLPALWTSFIADDYTMLRTIRRSTGLLWPFTHNDVGEPGSAGHFYRPFWILWNDAIHAIFGANAVAFHAANLVLFAVITLEVWLLARLLLGAGAAWVAGAAFALYPRHGESVDWISGNTDLVAAALGLAALLSLFAPWPLWGRTAAASALTAGAALSKEIAFALPVLAVLVLLAARAGDRRARPTDRWLPVAAIAVVALAALVVRSAVLGTVGGYTEYPWRPLRVVASLASYVVASVTPPQLQVLRHPELLVVPVLVLALVAWGVWRLRTTGDGRVRRVAVVGAAWFLVTLAPTLNLAVDLNTANGERLLFLPSVGLALVFAALVEAARSRWRAVALAGAALAVGAITVQNAHNWLVGGRIADRVLEATIALGPRDGKLVLLSVPDSYRSAHVFHGSLDVAVEQAGRTDLAISACLPVQVLTQRPSQVVFAPAPGGAYEGRTTWSAPFDFPVLRRATASLTPGCSYERADGERWPIGLGIVGRAFPSPPEGTVALAFFDGYTVLPWPPPPAG